ncbi:hypothetical protein M422DRAFT_274535 [Sphaerobolus stellatus SS14]|uniref:Uncharacterized protein n=1 Tax=Sphaerobolus stellatus (strain SS14) TaxID=990650 RepID=A0A0C9T6Q9_SPHS4|nr:hypothetical protein M422DRAFT_274535 [Sphaerobolus stellatus SS14]
MLPSEHPDEPHATAHGLRTAPSRVQSPIRVDVCPRTATQGLSPSRLTGASGTAHRGSPSPPRVTSFTATQGRYSPRGIERRSESRSDSGRVSPTRGDTEEHFMIHANEVEIFRQEYSEFITLKDNAEIVLAEAMEATERLNTVFSRVRASINKMSPRMKELLIVPANQASGKTLEPGNNRAHDRAAAQAATQRIIDQTAMIEPVPIAGAEERVRTTCSRVPGDPGHRFPGISPRIFPTLLTVSRVRTHSRDTAMRRTQCMRATHLKHGPSLSANQVIRGIPDSIERSRRSITEPQSIDMNALREEIKSTISATIKEKLRSDADSVTTVSQSMQALDSNAQYWSNLSNKATRCSRRALELQLKLAEEKVNNLLHEEAPEEALLEAAREVRTIHFQLDQNSHLREAGLMPEQQVWFSANTGRIAPSPSRNYGVNPIRESHTPRPEDNATLEDKALPPCLSLHN